MIPILKKINVKKHIIPNIPVFILAYAINKFSSVVQAEEGKTFGLKFMAAFGDLGAAFSNPLPSFDIIDILVGLAAGGLFLLILTDKRKNAKKYRQGREYGSARWGTAEDIRLYMDTKNADNNIILTQTEKLTMESRPKSGAKFARNKNILVIGGSGSGKTRFFVKPNLMQLHSSYIVTDPKVIVL